MSPGQKVTSVKSVGEVIGKVVDEVHQTGERVTAGLKAQSKKNNHAKVQTQDIKADVTSRYVITDNEMIATVIFFGYLHTSRIYYTPHAHTDLSRRDQLLTL